MRKNQLSEDRDILNLVELELRALFVFVFPCDLALGVILRGPFGNVHIGMRLRIVNPFCCHDLKYTYQNIKLLVENQRSPAKIASVW